LMKFWKKYRMHLLIAVYALLAAIYSIVVPLGENTDEIEHFRYVHTIVKTGNLPVMQPVLEENETAEAHQPPLLYMVGALLTGWIPQDTDDLLSFNTCYSSAPDDPGREHSLFHRDTEWPPQRGLYWAFYLMRWFSVLLGVGAVWFTYQLGRMLAPGNEHAAMAGAAVLAFNPQFIFITSSVNNDVPTLFFGVLLVWLAARYATKPAWGTAVPLALVAGLGMLTKFALIAFWPLGMLATGLPSLRAAWPGEKGLRPFLGRFFAAWRDWLPPLLLLLLLPLLLAGWWYWRNWLTHGDPLLWEVTLAAKGAVVARSGPLTAADLREFVVLHFQSYWLYFGLLNVQPPIWVYGFFLLLVITAVAGWLRIARRRDFPDPLPLLFTTLASLLIYASLWQYIQTINWTGYQGRLAFAAAGPLAVLTAAGLHAVHRRLPAFFAGGLLLISFLAVPLLLMPAYPRPQIYFPPQDATRTCIRLDGALQIEGVQTTARAAENGRLPVTVWGYGLTDSTQSSQLLLQVVGPQQQVLAEERATISWSRGAVISEMVEISLPAVGPLRGVLQIGMVGGEGTAVTATSATGRPLANPQGVLPIKIPPAAPLAAQPAVRIGANFADQLRLLGFDQQGGEITLYWQAVNPPVADYTTFVHVLDAETGALLTQHDSQPLNGAYPTTIWDPGEQVAEQKMVTLPPAETAYRVVAGAYRLETGERLPLVGGGDAVMLWETE
jgi:hypothetical protein